MTEPARHGESGLLETTAPLPPERLLHDWRSAHDRASAYLEALEVPPTEAAEFSWQSVASAASDPHWPAGSGATAQALATLRRLLVAAQGVETGGERGFLRWRLARMLAGAGSVRAPLGALPEGLRDAPELQRGHMIPHITGPDAKALRRWRRSLAWVRAARRRHLALAALVLVPSAVASSYMASVLPQQGRTGLELAIALVFGALFGWISIGFWTAIAGCWVRIRGDRFDVTRESEGAGPIAPEARTAILMPICEEPVERVFAGPARAAPVAGARRRARALRLLRALGQHRGLDGGRGGGGLGRLVPRGERLGPHLLPAPQGADGEEGRQRGRLLPALGPALPLHGRVRRRLRDVGRRARPAWSG